jgi:hypothetical protein
MCCASSAHNATTTAELWARLSGSLDVADLERTLAHPHAHVRRKAVDGNAAALELPRDDDRERSELTFARP